MKYSFVLKIIFFNLIIFLSSFCVATANQDEALEPGNELTPLGAELKGEDSIKNKLPPIPKWEKINQLEAKKFLTSPNKRHPNPYKDDILLTIDKNNHHEFVNYLTEGMKYLFKMYPETYRLNIYQTRRNVTMRSEINEATKNNISTAKLVDDGQGVEGARLGIPFPLTRNPQEMIWNHRLRYRGISVEVDRDSSYIVFKNSDKEESLFHLQISFDYSNPKRNNSLLGIFKQTNLSRGLEGEVLLASDSLNELSMPRNSSIGTTDGGFEPTPFMAHDYRRGVAGGVRTYDQYDMFNGSLEKYDWNLKYQDTQKIFVPYNAYVVYNELNHNEILTPKHINPELLRYEMHRVWVVEAKLKENTEHFYTRRIFYIDEDSWQILASENYDVKGNLYYSEAHCINFYDVLVFWSVLEVNYDFSTERYNAEKLIQKGSRFNFNDPSFDYSQLEFGALGED